MSSSGAGGSSASSDKETKPQKDGGKEPYNPKTDPSSPEFDLDAVPPPPPGGLPIDKLVVEPALFTGGMPGIMSKGSNAKKDKH